MKRNEVISMDEIKKLMKKQTSNISAVSMVVKNREPLYKELVSLTSFLPENSLINQRLWHLKYNDFSKHECRKDGCTNYARFISFIKGYAPYCSRECLNSDPEQYKKAKATNIERYGVDNHAKTEEARKAVSEKNKANAEIAAIHRKETLAKKYGKEITNVFQIEDVKKSIEETFLKKYGVNNYTQTSKYKAEVKEKFYTSLFHGRVGNLIEPMFNLTEYSGIKEGQHYEFKCKVCSNRFIDYLGGGHIPICRVCNPIERNTFKSKYEDEINSWLLSLGFSQDKILRNHRSLITPLEVDFYIPSKKLAIEFDGLWSHSESGGDKNEKYHIEKTEACKKLGVQLIHIFEDEWLFSKEIIKSIISIKVGKAKIVIRARDCEVKPVSSVMELKHYYTNTHMQGYIDTAKSYGLYYNSALVSCISLSRPRYDKNYEYELVRASNNLFTIVSGGFDRLIKYAIEDLKIKSLLSYVDLRYFSGSSYKSWSSLRQTQPNYFYTKDYSSRETRYKYRKSSLKKLFPDIYSDDLTEWQIMQLAGYDRIYDCGNYVFVKEGLYKENPIAHLSDKQEEIILPEGI